MYLEDDLEVQIYNALLVERSVKKAIRYLINEKKLVDSGYDPEVIEFKAMKVIQAIRISQRKLGFKLILISSIGLLIGTVLLFMSSGMHSSYKNDPRSFAITILLLSSSCLGYGVYKIISPNNFDAEL